MKFAADFAYSLPCCIILLRINELDQLLSSLIQAARFKERTIRKKHFSQDPFCMNEAVAEQLPFLKFYPRL